MILRDRLKAAAVRLNPNIPEAAIDDALDQVCDQRQAMATMVANRELDSLSGTECGSSSRGIMSACQIYLVCFWIWLLFFVFPVFIYCGLRFATYAIS